jgi:hypothetical protein
VVVAAKPCDHEGGLGIGEITGEERETRIALPTDADALSAGRTENGDLVTAGMFHQDHPNAWRGWYLRVRLTR